MEEQEPLDPVPVEPVQPLHSDSGCPAHPGGLAGCSACACVPRFDYSSWARLEFLLWWTKGMSSHPLVTSGTEAGGGVLGQPGTTALFPGGHLYDEVRWGGRLRVGSWLDRCQRFGIEGEYLILGGQHFDPIGKREKFEFTSAGSAILARPYFNVQTGQEDAALAFRYPVPVPPPDLPDDVLLGNPISGTITASVSSELQSAGAWLRLNRWCRRHGSNCQDPWIRNHLSVGGSRLDLLAGYRYYSLHEDLRIAEASTWTDVTEGDPPEDTVSDVTDYLISDAFDARNSFHGADIGLLYEHEYGDCWLEILGKVALGSNHQVVTIDGTTETTEYQVVTYDDPDTPPATTDPISDSESGGFLAQRTNIGTYSQNRFAVVPEIRITLGWQLTERLKTTIGYSLIYWSRVVLAGEQIDHRLNPNFFPLPGADPSSGPSRPAFAFHQSDYWAQGLSLGADYRW